MVIRQSCPIGGNTGTHGQGSFTPQNDGLHGRPSNTLHGAPGLSGSTAAAGGAPNTAPARTAINSACTRPEARIVFSAPRTPLAGGFTESRMRMGKRQGSPARSREAPGSAAPFLLGRSRGERGVRNLDVDIERRHL